MAWLCATLQQRVYLCTRRDAYVVFADARARVDAVDAIAAPPAAGSGLRMPLLSLLLWQRERVLCVTAF